MIRANDKLGLRLLPTQAKAVSKLTISNRGFCWIQGPNLGEIEKALNEEIVLTPQAQSIYEKMCRVRVTKQNNVYYFTFHSYPAKPWFIRDNFNYHLWIAMVNPVANSTRKFSTKYRFMVITAIEFLEKYGYDVQLSFGDLFTSAEGQASVEFGEMKVKPRSHQINNIVFSENRNYRIVIGDAAGLGKTVSALMLLYKLNKEGLVNRILWVVPNAQYTEQIKGEAEDKFGVEVHTVSGERYGRNERLGIEKHGEREVRVDQTEYEKHGFICTTWALFRKDFTKEKNYTQHIHFDAVVFDEVHCCKEGNSSYEASLQITAPVRISLTGTAMPNGKYEELYDILNVTDPPAAPYKKYFKTNMYKLIAKEKKKESAKKSNRKGEEEIKKEAKKRINKIALKYLVPKISYHSKSDVADSLPKLMETRLHTNLTPVDRVVFDNFRTMIGGLIEELKTYPDPWELDEKTKEEFYTVKATMVMVWQDLRRFCAFGAQAMGYRVQKYQTGQKGVYKVLRNYFKGNINELEKLVKEASECPKNEKIIDFLLRNTGNTKFVIFCTEIKPNKKLVFDILNRNIDAKVIMGKTNTLTEEEAKRLNQPHRFRDKDVQEVLDWFWMPWSAISDFLVTQREKNNLSTVTIRNAKGGKKILRNFFYTALATIYPREKGSSLNIRLNEWTDETEDFMRAINKDGFYKISVNKDQNLLHLNYNQEPKKVLVTTDKLQEGINLQDASCMIFYDYPFSIRSREQRMSRVWRDGSYHDTIQVVYAINGVEFKIEQKLKEKYKSGSVLGYQDPKPISMSDLLRML